MLARRALLGMAALGLPAVAALGFAGATGRIDLFTPRLPEDAELPPLPGLAHAQGPVLGLTRSAFFESVSLLNVWASWCPDCRSEHAALMALSSRPGILLFGLVADDSAERAAAYLREHGNPYRRVGVDAQRHYQRALKHRGVPQTYVFNNRGELVEKLSGALNATIIEARLLPAVEKARTLA